MPTTAQYEILYSGQPRKVVVALAPRDLLERRESGRRERWQLKTSGAGVGLSMTDRSASRKTTFLKKVKYILFHNNIFTLWHAQIISCHLWSWYPMAKTKVFTVQGFLPDIAALVWAFEYQSRRETPSPERSWRAPGSSTPERLSSIR